ncbi:E3 ubiquitin-protein ligase ZNF598 [Anastrepha obliqua]|uniref:E3 ubiquitin-protein ligase ZNF598 n=1 Tax=Anastrepha obliqua TaxID=95512 RepID=UPI00240A904B|nr:E3 ubiquitin-protein ligase ZNF598 [Anastrepha obliqua]
MSKSTQSVNDVANKHAASEEAEHDGCVLCCKEVEIYSIGECDHPICYECSTRLRVLCEQNECPICRQVLSKVIFTCDKLPYRELEAKNRSSYYSRKYKIGFYSAKIQQEFFNLLDHPCPKCDIVPFRRFNDLEYHVRKEHDLHFCDLCTEHLKIFTFERRCYTQTELGLHRTRGDRDNRSHRGHPLCEFCKKRYLDRDELFRHKRRDHYFCHFCDDESNDFYRDYDALANHFREHHFLCEEGRCATEQFVGAFRTEIDYKAHFASVHGKTLNKQEAKKTRTVQLEITLGRQARPGLADGGTTNVRSRVPDDNYPDPSEASTSHAGQQRGITIDRSNEEDFPLLGGSSGGPSVSLVPAPFVRLRSATSGLARTKENFPALGANGEGGVNENRTPTQQSTPPISTVLRKAPAVSPGAISRSSRGGGITGSSGSSGMVLHVSNRPTSSGGHNSGAVAKKPNAMDFPALPSSGKSKKNASRTPIDEDMLPSGEHIPLSNVAAKHRTLVEDYVSVANPSSFQKIQTVQKEEVESKNRRAAEQSNAPKLTSLDFPSLGGGTASRSIQVPSNNWAKGQKQSDKKQRELENRKAKVAPAPLLPKENKQTANAMNKKQSPPTVTNSKTSTTAVEQNAAKKEKKIKDKKEKLTTENSNQQQKLNGKSKGKSNNSNSNSPKRYNNSSSPLLSPANINEVSSQMRPPPGFGNQSAGTLPSTGFQSTNVTVNSVAKSPNNLTFTNSFGERYSIVRTHPYIPPSDAATRNQKLVSHFQDALKTPEGMEEFRHISQIFREGIYKTEPYYEHCQAALKDRFNDIFPELLVLLPDINKQQELYLVHSQHLNKLSPEKRKQALKLDVCPICKQVLMLSDLESHRKQHELKENFPVLGDTTANTNQRK